MPANKQRLVKAVERNIHRIEKTPVVAAPCLFIPHYPRYHDGALRIDCTGCNEQFKSFSLDTHEFARMISWQNEHIVSCGRKVIE